jgi:outer membrane immunogenic protein
MTRFAFALAATVSALALASAAQAADLIIEEPAPIGVVDVSGDWDGVYLGGFVGYGWGFADGPDDDLDGWLLGLALGANFTVADGIVAGVVGDIAWADINDGIVDTSVDWVGSLRGRLGFDGGSFLPYLTAGLAVASLTYDPTSETETFFGWTAGAGVEFAVTEDLSVDLLYRYSDYGDADFLPGTISLTTHQVSVGLNWSF